MKRFYGWLVLGGMCLLVPHSYAQESLLSFSPGAKSLLLGRTGVVQVYDPSALYWNPAALDVSKTNRALVSIHEMYRLNYSAFSVFFPPHGTFAFDLGRSDIGDTPIEFGSMGWGGAVHPNVYLGFSLSALQIEKEGWTTLGLGFLYTPSDNENHFGIFEPFYLNYVADRLTIGMSSQHIPLIVAGYDHQIRLGLSYSLLNDRLGLVCAYHHDRLNRAGHYGVQYHLFPSLALYAGVRDFNHHEATWGLSVSFSNVTANLGYDVKRERLAVGASFRMGQLPKVNAKKHYDKAKTLIQKQKKRRALHQAKKAVSYDPAHQPAKTMLETLQVVVKREDQRIDSLLSVADYFQKKAWYISAAAHYLKVLKLHPTNKRAEGAIREIRPKVNVHTEKWFQTGVKQYTAGKFHQAREIFESILLVRKGHRESQKYLDRIKTIFEKQAKEHYFTGLGYYSQHKLDRAEQEFEKAIRLLPTYDDAIEYLDKIRQEQQQNQQKIARLLSRADAHQSRNHLLRAIEDYQAILEIDPYHQPARAKIQNLQSRIDKAIENQMKMGISAFRNQEFKTAESAFRKVLSIDSQHNRARHYLNRISRDAQGRSQRYLQQAQQFYENKDYNRALAALDTLDRLQPRMQQTSALHDAILSAMSVESLYEKGENEYNRAQYIEAMEIFNQVLEKSPDHSKALEMRERCHIRLNELVEEYYNAGIQLYSTERYQSAIEQWKKALRINPYHKGSLEYIQKAQERVRALNELP